MKNLLMPMKLKFILVSLVLTTLAGITFYITATNLFREDKVAYIYSHAQQEALKIDNSFKNLFLDLENIFITFINQQRFPDEYIKFIVHKYSIMGIKVFKNNSEIYTFGKTSQPHKDRPHNDFEFTRDENERNIFYFQYTKELNGDKYSINYKIQYPEFYNLITEMESFQAYIIRHDGFQLLGSKRDSKLEVFEFYKEEIRRIKEEKIKATTVTKSIRGKEYLSSLLAINFGNQEYYLFLLQDHKQALNAINVFKLKSFLILIFIISISAIAAILFANKLTYNLGLLRSAAEKLSEENFDQPVTVKSSDEVGVLADTFDLMRVNIKGLLEKIREHNLYLEDKVKERTAELNEALQLQKAMVDNLDQGFFMFKHGGQILPIYSKASLNMFSQFEKKNTLGEVLAKNNDEAQGLNEFFDLMMSGEMPFNDVAQLAPLSFINEKEQIIHFNYTPVMSESQGIDFIVVVATDKTQEIKAFEEARKEKDYAKTIIRFVSRKRKFISLLENYKHQKIKFLSHADIQNLKIYIHTLKGSSSIYHLNNLAAYLHQIENQLDKMETIEASWLKGVFQKTDSYLNEELEKFGVMLGFDNLENAAQLKEIKTQEILEVYQLALQKDCPQLKQSFENAFLYEPVERMLPDFDEEIVRISSKLGKKVDPIEIINSSLKVPAKWEELFINLIHLTRNSIDHGIETPEVRKKLQKKESGKLSIEFLKNEDYFSIIFKDNGKGIPQDVLGHIFDKGFSTASEITEVSGRGVGLNALMNVITKLKGTIEVDSEQMKGTSFFIKIPFEKEAIDFEVA